MTPTKIKHDGQVYYSTHEAARRLGISDRTLLRWIEWLEQGHRPEELSDLRWFKQPVSGFNYFMASLVTATKKRLAAGQRIRPNGCKH